MNIATLDLGTTNAKASVVSVDEDSGSVEILNTVSRRLTPHTPEPEAYEHNPLEVKQCITEMLQHLSHKHRVDALVLSTYLFATTIVDRGLKPLTNIVTWVDERAKRYVELLRGRALELYRRTGCPPTHVYSLPKILWLRHEKPELLHNTMILDGKSLLTSWLLGYPVTDLSTASGTYQLLNIVQLTWDSLALEIAGVDENQLPELREAYFTDAITSSAAREIGFEPNTPLVLGLFDGGSMVYGLSRGRRGVAVVNLGTSAMLRTVASEPVVDSSPNMLLQTYYMMDRQWLCGGAINNAGAVVEYTLKLLGMDFTDLQRILSSEPPNPSRTPLTIPLLYLERLPGLPQHVRFTVQGLTPETTREHIIWGVVEGVLMLLKLIDESLQSSGVGYSEIMVGGGLSQYSGVLKALSSLFSRRVGIVRGIEAPHIGQALLALKVFSIRGIDCLLALVDRGVEYFRPSEDLHNLYSRKYSRFKDTLNLYHTII